MCLPCQGLPVILEWADGMTTVPAPGMVRVPFRWVADAIVNILSPDRPYVTQGGALPRARLPPWNELFREHNSGL